MFRIGKGRAAAVLARAATELSHKALPFSEGDALAATLSLLEPYMSDTLLDDLRGATPYPILVGMDEKVGVEFKNLRR